MAEARYPTLAESSYTEVLAALQYDTSLASWDCPFCGRTPHDTIFPPGQLGMSEIMVAAQHLYEENVQLSDQLDMYMASYARRSCFKVDPYGSYELASDLLDHDLASAAIQETQDVLFKIEHRLELCMTSSMALTLIFEANPTPIDSQESCNPLVNALNEAAVGLKHLTHEVCELQRLLGSSDGFKNEGTVPSIDMLQLDSLTLN